MFYLINNFAITLLRLIEVFNVENGSTLKMLQSFDQAVTGQWTLGKLVPNFKVKFESSAQIKLMSQIVIIGILLTGTELLDSPVRTDFSTESLYEVFIWLATEFSSDSGLQIFNKCDVTAMVTTLQWSRPHGGAADGSNLVQC